MFVNQRNIAGTWQNFERLVCRYLTYKGFDGPRIVGAPADKGADIVAHKGGKRWLFQVKHWRRRAGAAEVVKTVQALQFYGADIPVLVARNGFDESAMRQRAEFFGQGVSCQLWDSAFLIESAKKIDSAGYPPKAEEQHKTRPYQETAIKRLQEQLNSGAAPKGMIVMATGLGKTRVMCEFIRRVNARRETKVFALAHTNDLVYQLERAFWPFMRANQESLVWNGMERQTADSLRGADIVFACVNTVANYIANGGSLPDFDIVFVDECHHVGNDGMYQGVLQEMLAGTAGGPFLVGVTATPWRPDEYDLQQTFGEPLLTMDLVAGLRDGFLCGVDYRMYTTNLDWSRFGGEGAENRRISPKGINRTIFISEWDEGVVNEFERVWNELPNPRAIVFCGVISHAKMMRDRINARQFCRAEAVFSSAGKGEQQAAYERNKIISDFHAGKIQVVCCVDIFNEGIDVPDVNLVVFQRTTHSRRIFIQQLGRGLRLAPGKEKVIVLDFVSDVRRFAMGLELKNAVQGMPVRLNHKVDFYHYGETDRRSESFLREWLEDIAAVEGMGENAAELRYPPAMDPAIE
ncbi:MAG: DEAD/DEAH box helicase family protein [Gammaproteobacteria bacterium]|nr:DEAD/DEAH box helicase family protein [Gammaproteobacteria bacterium]